MINSYGNVVEILLQLQLLGFVLVKPPVDLPLISMKDNTLFSHLTSTNYKSHTTQRQLLRVLLQEIVYVNLLLLLGLLCQQWDKSLGVIPSPWCRAAQLKLNQG